MLEFLGELFVNLGGLSQWFGYFLPKRQDKMDLDSLKVRTIEATVHTSRS
jgi:hypothetical protein